MAVQAQYPSNAFSSRSSPREDYQQLLQHQESNLISGNPLAYYHHNHGVGAQQMVNGTIFSEPESELTYNASGSRKRVRESQTVAPLRDEQLFYHCQQQKQHPKVQDIVVNAAMSASTLAMERFNIDRIYDSGPTSTSGRSQDLDFYIINQNLDLEAFIQHQNQKLQAMVEESRKKHCGWLLWVLKQQTLTKLEEKERELQKVSKVNAELEEKMKQMCVENQMWFNVAKNSEATVFSLRQNLEQLLHHNNQAIEGFGETDGLVDDAQSPPQQQKQQPGKDSEERTTTLNLEIKNRKSCKGCGGADLSVLVLPCRHLCLCKDCDLRLHCCPVCNSNKNASLQVFIS